MLKFYRWLRLWAAKKTHQYVHCNIKCPKCNTWSSEIEGIKVGDMDWGYTWKCGQCNEETYWNSCIFPFPVISDQVGNPITIQKSKTF
jgi:hypothetical protein